MQVRTCLLVFSNFVSVRQSLAHGDEPGALFALEGLLVDALHHVLSEARAVCKHHVCVVPHDLENVTHDYFKSRSCCCRPSKDLLVIWRLYSFKVLIVDCFEVEADVL